MSPKETDDEMVKYVALKNRNYYLRSGVGTLFVEFICGDPT